MLTKAVANTTVHAPVHAPRYDQSWASSDFMKITSLLIGVCLVSLITGCHKPKASDAIEAAESTIKTTAVAAITAKYPSVRAFELKFNDMRIMATPQGTEDIVVIYEVPGSETPGADPQGGNAPTTTIKIFIVRMSPSAKIEGLNESTMKRTIR